MDSAKYELEPLVVEDFVINKVYRSRKNYEKFGKYVARVMYLGYPKIIRFDNPLKITAR